MADLPDGFSWAGVGCGIKESGKLDLAIISTEDPTTAAGVYTQNVVRATSIDWNRSITPTNQFRAIVINSGNANACTGDQGISDNESMATQVAKEIGASPDQILVLSTGVIGQHLPMANVSQGISAATKQLSSTADAFDASAEAILTTDKSTKTVHKSVVFGKRNIRISGIAKGAGMIGPNMATMLAVIMTDAQLSEADAQRVLINAAEASFNRISVEGHTSTNDALLLICSGKSGVEISSQSDLGEFESALTKSCIELAKCIPSDGEGATHLIAIQVVGAESIADADKVARTIAASALVKTAITGADPNWGRIVSAAGYSGVSMQANQIDLSINGHEVFKQGQPVKFDEPKVSQSMADNFETSIELKIGTGCESATHWTSDLTVEYVRFNSEYTT
jgi:glutamate N-acetyltransferase/amino-acid N-acetyltransferase